MSYSSTRPTWAEVSRAALGANYRLLREQAACAGADVVAFIHRDSYYNKDENGDEDPDSKGKAEIIIAKQRNGPTGSVHLAYLSEYTRFENLAQEGDVAGYE